MNPVEKESPLILLADDNKLMRLQLRRAMESQGYRIVEASDGEQCLALYQDLNPDVVLLDAMMPVMDGFTCCWQIQQLPGGDRTPVLMITGLDDKDSVDLAFEVGAADFVTKPIHWAVLYQRIRRLINQTQLYRQLEEANRTLQELACCDGLTQVANRRRFDEYLSQEWQRMKREQLPLSLILCDIDYFKAYNDTYGHQGGDDCLKQVAQGIERAAQRSSDLVARYGGEEFAVIMPNTPLQGAACVAEEIRKNVKALAIHHSQSLVSEYVTLSIGVATTIPHKNNNENHLIKMADKALYGAKSQGRDRTLIASNETNCCIPSS